MADAPGEGSDEEQQGAAEDTSMSEARLESSAPHVPAQILQVLQNRTSTLAERVTRRVQAEIPAYAGTTAGRRRKLIGMAVTESAGLFLRTLGGRKMSTAGVDDLFRRMGYGEASEGHDLDALDAALRIAGREAWQGLQEVVVAAGLPASTLGRLADELFAFLDHLGEQAHAGHAMAHRVRERDVTTNRRQLFEALVSGVEVSGVRMHAELAGWPLPAKVVAIAASAAGPVEWPDSDMLEGQALAGTTPGRATFLAPGETADEVVEQLRSLDADLTIARSWPVALADAAHAHRWAVRALELSENGAIPRQQIVDCAQYRTQLWLHSEPALRRQLAQELLRPLFAETPNSREILSETLLVWLETRESAPAIAAILGVHPQTVRYRWRRINELFGDALHDPEFVVQLTMVLKASVPLWVAGDQSDFERYWTEEGR
jgi:hypothetical protein